MQVTNRPNIFQRIGAKFQKPEGPGERITGKDLVNDAALLIDGAATTATSVVTGLSTAVAFSQPGPVGLAVGVAGTYAGYQLSKVGNLAGNLVSEATGSAKAGRIARAGVKAGLLVGGLVAVGAGLTGGLFALGTGGVVYAMGQFLKDDLMALYGPDPAASKAVPKQDTPNPNPPLETDAPNLLSTDSPSELEAPNLLSADAPSEFDAPNLLAASNDSLSSLNKGNPKVLIQTA